MNKIVLFLFFTLAINAQNIKSSIDHIVVVYLENRSFDSMFRGFEGADTSDKPLKSYLPQVDNNSTVYKMIPLTSEAVAAKLPKEITNSPFSLDGYISKSDTMPDLIHRFYQSQSQINGGLNNRFAVISDQGGLVMGYHDSSNSAIWRYAKEYTLCDNFFSAAYGGSFLNHQWLIAARTPYAGMDSNLSKYVLDKNGDTIKDGVLTPDGYVVNTVQPYFPPFEDGKKKLKPLEYPTIGDRLSQKGVSWGWYSGDYDAVMKGEGQKVNYQYHHNPFVYFKNYAPNTKGRKHIKDEKEFFSELKDQNLQSVVFFKPSAIDNQHPGYSNIDAADKKVEQIIESIKKEPKIWQKTIIIVTYDENGGLWDHVAPPKADRWGPGTRVPAVVISPLVKKHFVDHTIYDTTSILRFIEWKHGLKRLWKKKSNNMLNILK